MGPFEDYREADRAEVACFLRDPRSLHLYLETRLAAPEEGQGFVWRTAEGVRGFAWIGRGQNLVFAGEDAEFLASLAVLARRMEDRWLMAVGPREPAANFLSVYHGLSRRRPRIDRVQLFMRLTAGTLAETGEPRLRAATGDDLEETVLAAIRMNAEDFDIEPWRIDRQGVRRGMERKIREGRCFVHAERGRLVFKADVAARGPGGVQVEGVYTAGEHRNRGIASRCLAEMGRRLLADYPSVVLHVARENLSARRAYENAGYRHEADLRLTILE